MPTPRRSTASEPAAVGPVDGLTASAELKESKAVKPLQESRESRAARRETEQLRTLDERDLKRKAEQNTLRSNTHRRVERSRSSTATTAASSLTQSAVQVHTRVKFRHISQTKAQAHTQFNERRPTRPMGRQQYVNTLKATYGRVDCNNA